MLTYRPLLVPLAAALVLAACDIPTDAPIVDGTWVVPVGADSISVAELLPSNVTISSGAFVFSVPAATGQQTLGQLCSCAGGVAPKPAFTGDVNVSVALPSSVVQATIAGADVQFSLTHNLGFDPIRPSASARGTITITVRSAGLVIGTRVIDGTATALPSGSTRLETVPITAGSVVNGAVNVQIAVSSPAGDPVLIDPARTFSVTGTPQNVRASAASVRVANEVIAPTSSAADVGSVSADIRSKILSASLALQLANPFAVAGTFSLRFRSAGTDVIPAHSITVTGGAQSIILALSKTEIDALIAAGSLTLELSGTVSGTAAGQLVAVAPTQVVRVTPRLSLATRIGA